MTVHFLASELPDAVKNNPVVLYVIIILFIAGMLLTWLGDKVPLIGKVIDAWNARRRRSAKATKAADVADLRNQLAHFKTRVQDLDNEVRGLHGDLRVRDDLAAAHQAWDRDLRARVIALSPPGADVPEQPPPLYPPPPSQRARA